MYRVSKGEKPEEMSVHLARIERYYAPSTRSAPDFDALDDIFLGTKIPVADFDNVQSQVRIKNLVVNAIESHRRGIGKPSPTNFQNLFTFRGYPPSQGAWCHVNAVPQCFQLIAAYRARLLAQDPHAFDLPPNKGKSSTQSAGVPVPGPSS